MSDFPVSEIRPTDRRGMAGVLSLLQAEGIRPDPHISYTCGIFDDDYRLVATGSLCWNTLRCLAVSRAHQGEGLMNRIVSHLVQYQYEHGVTQLFLYTKYDTAKFFADLGFYEVARDGGQVVFMENRRDGFSDYLSQLIRETASGIPSPASLSPSVNDRKRIAAIVMNANPFTLGHLYLAERAAAENAVVHLFIVSEDASLIPFAVRRRLVREGVAHLSNVVCHDSGSYMISRATFPSYFLRDETVVAESHARLDLAVFAKIAAALRIDVRYVGEEPKSPVTDLYNQLMRKELPAHGIDCVILPRLGIGGTLISASEVRQALKNGDWKTVRQMVPASTLRYLESAEAKTVLESIRAAESITHG